MKIPTTAAQMVEQFDQRTQRWNPFAKRDGRLTASDTGLRFAGGNKSAPFVTALSKLSDTEFWATVGNMDNGAKKAFLYNKYPEFFRRWDDGQELFSPVDPYKTPRGVNAKRVMDGFVGYGELWTKAGELSLERLKVEIKGAIPEQRDRELLASTDWLEGSPAEGTDHAMQHARDQVCSSVATMQRVDWRPSDLFIKNIEDRQEVARLYLQGKKH